MTRDCNHKRYAESLECKDCKIEKQAEQIADYNNQYDSLKSIIGGLERRLEYKDGENQRLKKKLLVTKQTIYHLKNKSKF